MPQNQGFVGGNNQNKTDFTPCLLNGVTKEPIRQEGFSDICFPEQHSSLKEILPSESEALDLFCICQLLLHCGGDNVRHLLPRMEFLLRNIGKELKTTGQTLSN